MPTLFRLLMACAVLAGLVYGGMWALVLLVQPRERDVVVRISPEQLNAASPVAEQAEKAGSQ